MSFDMLLQEVESLPEGQRRKLLAFIVALEDRANTGYTAKLAQKIDDKDPGRWLSVEECARRLWIARRTTVNGRRLLVDIDVLEFLRTRRQSEQTQLLRRFREIGTAPDRFVDYMEPEASGRDVAVHVYGLFAIKFWDDFADRHVKILDVHLADRQRR